MLAGSAPTVAEALERTGPAGVEWKLDGIRVQLHRDGDEVRIFTRSLDEITDRMPEVVGRGAAPACPDRAVLDGEVLALRPDGRPLPVPADRVPHGDPVRPGRRARRAPR